MNQLPETGFLRLPQIIGDPKAEPPIPPIPIKKMLVGWRQPALPQAGKTWAAWTAWRVEDIRALIASA
ncbi:MAG: transcriptional regulator [Rhodocyclaceae bacterium]|nr:transcriptional regulator [Rhodocyclaceae bacterium]